MPLLCIHMRLHKNNFQMSHCNIKYILFLYSRFIHSTYASNNTYFSSQFFYVIFSLYLLLRIFYIQKWCMYIALKSKTCELFEKFKVGTLIHPHNYYYFI